jgi:hypothetical protein
MLDELEHDLTDEEQGLLRQLNDDVQRAISVGSPTLMDEADRQLDELRTRILTRLGIRADQAISWREEGGVVRLFVRTG